MLTVQGRTLEVSREAAGVARFSFAELCARPLGAGGGGLSGVGGETFHTILIDHVPVMTRRESAMKPPASSPSLTRFTTPAPSSFMSAEAEPASLYPAGDGAFEFQRTRSHA